MKKKWVWLIVIIAFLAIALFACNSMRRISRSSLQGSEEDVLVEGVSEYGNGYCVTENGVLYGKLLTIRYYDFETDDEYILCDKVNCTHLTGSCSAHYNGENMAGLALYQGNVYLIDKNWGQNVFELIRMNTTGGDRKVIASWDIGDVENESWHIANVASACYYGGYAWIEFAYEYIMEDGNVVRCSQWVQQDLEGAGTTELTALATSGEKWKVIGFGREYLLMEKMWPADSDEGHQWMDSYYAYNIREKTMRLLEEGNAYVDADAGGMEYQMSTYSCEGEYGDGFLCHAPQWELDTKEGNAAFFVWNPSDNTKTDILTLEHGSLVGMGGESSFPKYVYDDSYMIGAQFPGNGKAEICLIDLDAKEVQTLFEDAENITFRLIGITSDKVVGRIFDFTDAATIVEVCYLDKEDYYNGDFSHKKWIDRYTW